MDKPQPAYQGDDPYIFISYSHDDAIAFDEINWLQNNSVNVWYDEGISAGSEWSESIARAIKHCSRFVYLTQSHLRIAGGKSISRLLRIDQ